MIEADVVRILNTVKLFGRADRTLKDKYPVIIESQNGVHPMDNWFFLVGTINQYNTGTSTKTLTSRSEVVIEDGVKYKTWQMNQPKAYEVRICMQGSKDRDGRGNGIEDIIEILKLQMDTPKIRRMFNDVGYSYEIDVQTINIPMVLNTDQYVRYSFKVTFRTNISFEIEQEVMDRMEVKGKFLDSGKNIIEEYSETVDENTIINSKGK